jgi:putative transcriptional regulator
MAIIINIDVMLAKRKMSVTELADKVGITMANISVLPRFGTKWVKIGVRPSILRFHA